MMPERDDAERMAHIMSIAEDAATKAVYKTLIAIGIDPTNPIKEQAEFFRMRTAAEIISDDEFAKDMAHLRRWRVAVEGAQSKGFLAMVAIIASGILGALWLGAQDLLARH